MKHFVLILVGAVMLSAGCKTVDVGSEPKTPLAVGLRAEDVMKACKDNQMRFFDPKGEEHSRRCPRAGTAACLSITRT